MLGHKPPPVPTPAHQERGPNCWGCAFFGISHNPTSPYACHLMGFQSRNLPSIEVLRADGHFCRGFSPKSPTCQTFGTSRIHDVN